MPKNQIIKAISGLLNATDVQFEDEPAIEEALFIWKDATADFADCLIGAKNRRMKVLPLNTPSAHFQLFVLTA